MKYLIFEPTLTGHHLEYLHHIYNHINSYPDDLFIFAVPEKEWDTIKHKCIWTPQRNVKWVMLDDEKCRRIKTGNKISRGIKISKLINKIARQENVNRIKLISLAETIPFLFILSRKSIKIDGIIYKIYLRAKNSFSSRLVNRTRYYIAAHSFSCGNIFVLNDPRSAKKLNKTYKTQNFISLTDPVPTEEYSQTTNLRSELKIPKDAIVFLHFGAMSVRKGTLEILKALDYASDKLSDKYFIFAGKIADNLKKDFYYLANTLQRKGINIIIKDEFCSFASLHSMCHSSDCILIPYLLADLSSGALGYASLHKKPVIGPESGLIGELIKDNNLGITLPRISHETIAEAIIKFKPYDISNSYATQNSIKTFATTFLRH